MKPWAALSALAGLALIVAVLGAHWGARPASRIPGADSASVERPSAGPSPEVGLSEVPEAGARRSAKQAPGETKIMEPDTATLMDSILKAALSGDARLWRRVSERELLQLVKRDPAAAAGLALGLEPGLIREQIVRCVAQGWAAQDPTAALGWAAGLPDPLERSSALADACVQIGQASSQDAVEAATHFGVEDQDGCLEHIVQRWATQDAAGAVAWVSQLPAGSERDGLMAGMATAVAHVSPVAAVDAVADEISSESLREEATISIVHEWGLQDPAAASAWASQLPEGPVADRAKRELAGISEYGLASGR